MSIQYPKVLIVTRNVWDDSAGISSTDSNLFKNYMPEALSQIYIETKIPHTEHCTNFFQISEYSLIKRLWNKRIKTGKPIQQLKKNSTIQTDAVGNREQKIMSYVRNNRSMVYTFAREILWLFNGWKSKELNQFLANNTSDVLFIFCSPLILMNRLQYFVLCSMDKPAACYFMDDIYTYQSVKGGGLFNYIYRFFLRITVRRVIRKCQDFFVISPKMKKEYDSIFNIDSKILTKGIDFRVLDYKPKVLSNPLKIIYLGQIIYGRVHSLITMVNTLKKINENGVKAQLRIYTGNFLSNEMREKLVIENTSQVMPLVPYDQIHQIMAEADVVVFAESLNKRYKNIARLSFSTKLTDYFSAGKCIFAIGESDVAPIEYLKENDVAIVATSEAEIEEKILYLIRNPHVIEEYAEKSFHLGRRNHNLNDMNELLYKSLIELNSKG